MRCAFIALIMLFVSACASVPQGQQIHRCLPPDIPPDVLLWSVVKTRNVPGPVVRGKAQVIHIIKYQHAGTLIEIAWIAGEIMLVDPQPEDRNAPVLRDDGILDEQLRFREKPAPACRWVVTHIRSA